ncbi:molybdopterin molybdotransferase MoeA [Sphingomonas sp.]|uniref:molybdopterin molybdotransferase MoeA n=1 Tax=Sphingomonas sp. TaxID=28214 RepID=UPI002B6F98CE|nr:molybdopterin molybdotransferase MoeA [Sphingomonas sp.]HTG38573.1 molybdopterin molybdotransferase MoeA [Sphingomonas sp.]
MALLPVEEAQARLLALAGPVEVATVPLSAASGRWTSASVAALRTQPSHDLSAMDGYAIAHADLPGPFCLVGESAAGRPFAGSIGGGQTVRIFTGAAMPDGADCVLVQEEARTQGDAVWLDGDGPAHPGRNVRRRGLDFSREDILIEAGERLTPARVALAAVAGHAGLPVRRKVRVAIAATGDELRPAGAPLEDGALPESNGVMLAAMLADLPVTIIDLGILPDRLDALRDAFSGVTADLLITTGGASVGDHDLVRPALAAAGAALDFWRVALRPGKPMLAGRLNDMVVIGLPGNPVSAFVTATLFVRPVIAHLAGAKAPVPALAEARLGEALPANGERTDYLRATRINGKVHVATIQDSSMLKTLARADCLVLRPPHAPPAAAGETVAIVPLA